MKLWQAFLFVALLGIIMIYSAIAMRMQNIAVADQVQVTGYVVDSVGAIGFVYMLLRGRVKI